MTAPPLKKPKLEQDGRSLLSRTSNSSSIEPLSPSPMARDDDDNRAGARWEDDSREEQEEALVALIEHRTKEVEHLRHRLSYYKSQLEESEKRLHDSEAKLARLRGRNSALPSKSYLENGNKRVKVERKSPSPIYAKDDCSISGSQPQSKPGLVIPAVNPKPSQPIQSARSTAKASNGNNGQDIQPVSGKSCSGAKVKVENIFSPDQELTESQSKGGIQRKFEHKKHKELIPKVSSRSSPKVIKCHTSNHISSQHKRKLRSLALCPVNDQLFVTSALDGVVNLWQIDSLGSGASLLSSNDCLSPKQRRWPEDITWHPQGNSLFAVYSAEDGDSQISILNLNKTQGGARATFLEDKPHVKGIINSIIFMPWENICFATGGSDHAVILWNERDGDNLWKPKALHKNMHSSAVMGVAGMQQKQIILSVGLDKRIIGYDVLAEQADFRHQIDYKCMSVVPNPCDFNLYMVRSGSHGKQLRLFDIRLKETEIHAFGWKQESSESQSALINQAWSPDGLYISSGSADPMIHIFDIRYNAHKPSQSIRAHKKRVFKAEWHSHLPLLISISSDLHIGMHKI